MTTLRPLVGELRLPKSSEPDVFGLKLAGYFGSGVAVHRRAGSGDAGSMELSSKT